MKKLVTIRKAPDGKGKYVNKTAKFLDKAQAGGQQQGGYNQKILEYVAQEILQREQDPQAVYQSLIESKIDEETALLHVQAIMQYQQQMMAEQQGAPQEQAADQETAYSQAADEVEQDLASQYGYYNPSGVGQELAADDSEEQINQEADEDVYNMVMGEEDGEYQDGGDVIDNYIVNRSLPNYLDFEGDDLNALNYANGGAKNKRSFIKNVMSELKKAREGMQQEQQDPSEQFDMTDTLTLDRGKKKSKFVEGLARVTQTAKDKQKAEQAWEQQQMLQQQGQPMPPMQMPMGQDGGQQPLTDTEHPYHHLAMIQQANQEIMGNDMNATFSAQSGMTMPSPREYRKMHRQVSRMLPNIYLDPNIKGSELSVHKTNWLGRPKEYDIKFQGNQGIMPGWGHGTLLLGLPGGANMGWGNGWNTSWGSNWNTVKGIVETQKVKREGIIRDINKQADPAPKGQNEVDKVVADQSTVVKDANGNPIISDGSNIQYNPSGTNMPIADQSGAPTMQVNNQSSGSGLNFDDPNSTQIMIQEGLNELNPNGNLKKGDQLLQEIISKKRQPIVGETYDTWWTSDGSTPGFAPDNRKWDGTQWKQMGGFADPESGLTRFVYGGDENIFNDDRNTINTADPYFGRMYRNGGMPYFEGGGQWVTKPDGTTVFLKDDGTIDKTKTAMSEEEKKLYDENVLKRNKEYYEQNKDKFVNQADQNKLIEDAVNKRMEQYTRQFGNNMQQQQGNYYTNFGQRYNPGYNYMPGYRSNGFLDQLFSANLAPNYLGTWSKLKGLETSNGMPFTGFDDKTHLTNLKVTKSGWLSGRPKEYELSFSKYIDPRTANNITLDPNKNAQIQSQNKDQVKLDPNAKPGTLERGWSPEELDTMKERRMARRHDRFIDDIRASKGDNSDVVNNNQTNKNLSPVDLSNNVGPVNDITENEFQPNKSAMDYMKQSLTLSGSTSPKTELEKQIQNTNQQKPSAFTEGDPRGDFMNSQLKVTPNYSPTNNSGPVNTNTGEEDEFKVNQDAINYMQSQFPKSSSKVTNEPMPTNFPAFTTMMDNPNGFAYGGYMPDYMAYGGYLPTAEGGNNPVDYTMNPAFVGKSNLDLISTYDNMGPDTGLQPSSMWSDMNSFGFAPQGQELKDEYLKDCTEADKLDPTSKCYEGIKLNEKDPMSMNPEALKKEMMDKQDVKMKFKNKDVKQYDTEAWLGAANKVGSIFPWLKNKQEVRKLQGQKIDNKTSDNVYASNVAGDPFKKTGAYSVTGSSYGLFDPRNQGAISNSGGVQKGGELQEGGVTYMTADEVRRFMEEGGQIEFI